MAINDTIAAVKKFVNSNLTVPLNLLIDNTRIIITDHITESISTLTTKVNALQTESNALTRYNNTISAVNGGKASLTGEGKTIFTYSGTINVGSIAAKFVAPVDGLYKLTTTNSNTGACKIYKMLGESCFAKVGSSSSYEALPSLLYEAYSTDSVGSGSYNISETPSAYVMSSSAGSAFFYARAGEPVILFVSYDSSANLKGTITVTYQQR